jgi:hypothetical protein
MNNASVNILFLIGLLFFHIALTWFHVTLDLGIRDRFAGVVRWVFLLTKWAAEVVAILISLICMFFVQYEYQIDFLDNDVALYISLLYWAVTFFVPAAYFFNLRKEEFKRHGLTIWGR